MKMDKSIAVKRLEAFFDRRHQGIVCVYLFGSLARGEAGEGSDVDIAVLCAEKPPSTLDGLGLDLSGELETLIGRRVDLVVLNSAPVDLSHRVLRDGVLIYDGNPSARVRFEVNARNEYFDLLPYLREYRRGSGRARP